MYQECLLRPEILIVIPGTLKVMCPREIKPKAPRKGSKRPACNRTRPLHTNSGYGKREAHINWSVVKPEGSTHYLNYLEDYWPSAGGLSAVNAIGTQLRDPINSGLTRWR
ncbi:unnamed protein product, partial [Ascophyllum nodosum]